MRLSVVRDLVTHAGLQGELAAIFEFSLEFTFDAEQDMAFDTPMVCEIAGGVLDPADANASEM